MNWFKSKKGFSLVEMIIAIGLLGAVTIGTGIYISNSFKDSNKLVNKADVQNSVTALMNKIETAIKMADIPVGEKTDDGFIIYQQTETQERAVKFIHKNNKVTVKRGLKTEASYEYIQSVEIEFLERGAEITIIGQDELYKLTGAYYTRNTMGSNKVEITPVPVPVPEPEPVPVPAGYYKLTVSNNGITSIEKEYEAGTIAQTTAQVPEGATWKGWYIGTSLYSTSKELKITMNENKEVKAVWKYKLTIQNNGVTSISKECKPGSIVQVTAQVPEGATWKGWYVGSTLYSTDKKLGITMNEDKQVNAVWE